MKLINTPRLAIANTNPPVMAMAGTNSAAIVLCGCNGYLNSQHSCQNTLQTMVSYETTSILTSAKDASSYALCMARGKPAGYLHAGRGRGNERRGASPLRANPVRPSRAGLLGEGRRLAG